MLGEIAWAAVRARGTSFGARFRRLARRQGVQKAVVAVMHNLLTVIYAVVRDGTPYHELGLDYFLPQDPKRAAQRHVAQLERLGCRVAITPAAAALRPGGEDLRRKERQVWLGGRPGGRHR